MAFIVTNQIVERTGLPENTVQTVFDALRDILVEQNAIGESVNVRGIFTSKPVRFTQLTPRGTTKGFTAKLVASQSLVDAITAASLNPTNLAKAQQNAMNIEQAMANAGISVMEIAGLG